MKFSVLISVYDKENPSFLRESLESLINQSLLPDEIVLVKDGPLGEGLDFVVDDFCAKFPQVFNVVALAENRGLGLALQEGLKHCTHELVARMDSDDICHKRRFEEQISFLTRHPEVSVVGADISEFVKSAKNIVSYKRLPQKNEELYRYAKIRCPLNHTTVVFKKKDVLSSGGYRHFPYYEDYYLWARMIKKGFIIRNIPKSLVYVRVDSMVNRRRGWNYIFLDIDFQKKMREMSLVSSLEMYRNIIVRNLPRLLPIFIFKYFYQFILRKASPKS